MKASALCSASSLTAPAGTVTPTAPGTAPGAPDCPGGGPLKARRSIQLDAFFGKVLHRAGMEWDRRSGGLLVLELEVLSFLVHVDQVGALVDDGLDDVVGRLLVHALVR